jgi:hypothetical protein
MESEGATDEAVNIVQKKKRKSKIIPLFNKPPGNSNRSSEGLKKR